MQRPLPFREQCLPIHFQRQLSHQLFGVLNRTIGKVDIETGIGFGLTGASDDVTMKFMVAYDFNKPRAVTK